MVVTKILSFCSRVTKPNLPVAKYDQKTAGWVLLLVYCDMKFSLSSAQWYICTRVPRWLQNTWVTKHDTYNLTVHTVRYSAPHKTNDMRHRDSLMMRHRIKLTVRLCCVRVWVVHVTTEPNDPQTHTLTFSASFCELLHASPTTLSTQVVEALQPHAPLSFACVVP